LNRPVPQPNPGLELPSLKTYFFRVIGAFYLVHKSRYIGRSLIYAVSFANGNVLTLKYCQ